VEKRNSFSLSTDARHVVDQLKTGLTAALENGIQVVHRKADVVNPGTALLHEPPDRRVRLDGFQQLDQRFSRCKSRDLCPIRIIQLDLGQAKNIPEKRHALAERPDRDANV